MNRFVLNRLILSVLVVLQLLGCAPEVAEKVQNEDTIRVLFIGNSHTFTNDVPKLVKRINDAQPGSPAIRVSTVMAGGYRLADHLRDGGATKAIGQAEWDYVVIQPASSEPFADPDGQISSFRSMLESVRPKTIPILYGIWHREAGDELYTSFRTTPAGAARTIRQTNLATIRDTRAQLAPVGDAWVTAQLKHKDIRLYTDGNHASLEGSYLAAAVVLRAILQGPLDTAQIWRPQGLAHNRAVKLLDVANTVTLNAPTLN